MQLKLKSGLGLFVMLLGTHAMAQVTFYEGEDFRGRTFTTGKAVNNLQRNGFNDLASSVIVESGRWEVCEDAAFKGRCMVLRPGNYDSLRGMDLNNRISSVRAVGWRREYVNEAPDPVAGPAYDYRRRPNERVYNAQVTSVHAVVGPPEQRCWVEHQPAVEPARSSNPNMGGAIAGALLGGILGHQVGGGVGKDLATVGGAVAGGMVGSNVGRGSGAGGAPAADIRKCETVASSAPPQFWDVTYNFRGTDHKLQMKTAPGTTIVVNENGDPRQ
jgi:uncharacterized protein YcfJ